MAEAPLGCPVILPRWRSDCLIKKYNSSEHRHREWAEREIDELLHIMPTPRQLADVLAVTRDCVQAIPH